MKLSNQIFSTNVGKGWVGIYSPFGHNIAFVTDEEWEMLKDGNFDLIDLELINFLKQNHILVKPGFEKRWLKDNLILPSIDVYIMFLVTTMRCDLACKYCVIMGNEEPELNQIDKMDVDTGRAAVKFFADNLSKNKPPRARVTFYGGEPMLNQKIMFELIPAIKKIEYEGMEASVEIVVITNGYSYNPELTDLFKKYSVNIAISLDGMKKHHDPVRVTKGNKPTFDRVVTNLKRYQDEGLAVAISTTVGTHNVNDIPDIARYFADELGVTGVEFQIPYQVPGNGNKYWVTGGSLAKKLLEAHRILNSYGGNEGSTLRRLRDFFNGTLRFKDCPSIGQQIVVAPDGMIGPCHSLVGSRKYFAGNLKEEPDLNKMPDFIEWANRHPINMPVCQNCPFISLCGGGCPYNSYVAYGTIWAKDPQVCSYMEEFVDGVLKDIWSRIESKDDY